jgi:hypothetical protein
MITVSLEAVKEQTVNVALNQQQCSIRLVQRDSAIYMDLSVNNVPLIQGVPCLYANKMVRYSYLGFSGDLVFLDTQGTSDPEYSNLGGRYKLFYMTEAELVQ